MNNRIRKLFAAVCIVFSLVLSVPALASTLGISQMMSTVSAATGWVTDKKGTYYLQDDVRLTGLQQIGKYTYYLDANGYRVTGPATINGTTYFFRYSNGRLLTGKSGLYKGSTDYEDQLYYYYFTDAKNGTIATSCWVESKGRLFYADKTGRIRLGTIKIGSKMYHITKSGRLTGYTRSSYNKKYYYASSSGVLKTGIQKINGYYYYFSPSSGIRLTGAVTINGKLYYFSKTSYYAKKGWLKISGKYYYHDNNYQRVTGWKTINGKRYYLSPNRNGARLSGGWFKISGYYYYFNSKGVLQTGLLKINNKLYYTNSKGQRQSGWVTVGGKRYYFLKTNNNQAATGYYYLDSNYYYFNPTVGSSAYGAAQTGMVKIGSYWYYFGTNYARQTGWVRYNMRDYYFDKNTGRMLTGTQTIDGKVYHLGISGGITVNTSSISGSWSIYVSRKQNFVVVYKGNTEIKAFVCSTARDGVSTPYGNFSIMDKLRWHELNGPSWGQYCSHITWNILFHSVPCYSYRNPYSMSVSSYNMLGSPASAGCIRLTVEHAKWLYDYCPIGTPVYVRDYISQPTTVTIEQAPKITSTLSQSYDPTDPNLPENRKS